MYVGPDRSGNPLEVGVVDWHDALAIVHAMPARENVPEVMTVPRSIDELIAHADEIADRFENYEPQDSDRREPPLLALRRLAYRRSLVERELAEAVRDARGAGASWAKIGNELGTSGEAARQRYGDRVA